MSAAKHTPGPWNALEVDTGWTVGPCETDGADYVADVHKLVSGRSDEASDANAHLIAAAPDLLAALEALATYAPVEVVKDDFAYDRLLDAVRDVARAAIQKARGES